MAVDLALKGTAITNREATPRVLNNPGLGEGGRAKCAIGHLASVTAALTTTSIIRLVSIPSNAVVSHVFFQSAAQAAGAMDVGVYRTNADGGAVVDQDFFATAIAVTGAVVLTNVTNESAAAGGYTIAKQSMPLWQAAGMTSDPKSMLDIACTIVSADVTDGLGAVGLKVYYVD